MKRSPLILNAGQQQQLQAADYADIGIAYMMHKNRLINGDFDVWQRGTALKDITVTGTYYPDRWAYDFDGTGASISVQRMAFTPGQTDVPDNPTYYCENSISIAASGQTINQMRQRIEGCQTFQGQNVTLSFYAKADAARTLSATLDRVYGTGGSPSANEATIIGVPSFNLTTSWAKYSYSAPLSSTTGKTLGTNGDDSLQLRFLFPLNSGFTIDIAHVQLEAGSNATQFEKRFLAHEMVLCKRYFEVICPALQYGGFGTGWVNTSNTGLPFVTYLTKRVAPTLTYTAPNTFYLNVAGGFGGAVATVIHTENGSSTVGAQIHVENAGGLTPGQCCGLISNVAGGAFIYIDAEL